MHAGGREAYAWDQLLYTAWDLSVDCLARPRVALYGGGWALGGPHLRILVVVGVGS